MPLSLPRIFVHIHDDIIDLDNVSLIAEEFKRYKSHAFQIALDSEADVSNFLPVLDEEDQQNFLPDHPFFGRDRAYHGERIKAANDDVYHVHLHHDETIRSWYDFDVANVFVSQWNCVSDAALVYAYLKTESEDYHFLLIEVVSPGIHDAAREDGKIAEWRHKAKNFRLTSDVPILKL